MRLTLHLKVDFILLTTPGAIRTHFEWKRFRQPLHSSSGKPETPGQYGVHAFCCWSPMLEHKKRKS